MIGESTNVMAAWEKRAPWLARWTLDRLLNRVDLWAKYLPVEKHRRTAGGESRHHRLAPLAAKRGKLKLTERLLERHYSGHDVGHILGIHAASVENTSRWIAIDLERHDERAVPLNNLRAITHWREELISMGFRPLMIETDGAGGYQLLTLFRDPLPTARAYDFVQRLVSDHTDAGLEDLPNILPNGPQHDDNNWLTLPGRHPLTGHWSRVWNGHRWLQGADAIEALLRAHGDAPTLIRKLPATRTTESGGGNGAALPATAPATSEPRQPSTAMGDDVESQILCYLLAASRTDHATIAFVGVEAADVNPDAFQNAVHRHIFGALMTLSRQKEHITPTLIAQQIPEDQRAAALGIIDALMIQKPLGEDEFEDRLANLSRRSSATRQSICGDHVTAGGDSQVDQILNLWPRLSPAARQALLTLAQSASQG